MEEEKKTPDAELLSENEAVATPEAEADEAPTVSDTIVTKQEEVAPEAESENEIATEPEAEAADEAGPAAVADIPSPGDIIQQRGLNTLLPQFPVIGDGEAVSFIPHRLQ